MTAELKKKKKELESKNKYIEKLESVVKEAEEMLDSIVVDVLIDIFKELL